MKKFLSSLGVLLLFGFSFGFFTFVVIKTALSTENLLMGTLMLIGVSIVCLSSLNLRREKDNERY